MAMHPLERGMLGEYVTFTPKAGTDAAGVVTWGSPVGPVLCHLEGPTQRTVTERSESRSVPARIWIDAPDFDEDAIPVGSKVTLPNGQERILTSIDAMNHMASDPFDTGVHHWELATN